MRPPEWFVSALGAMDTLLRLRWGSHVGAWVIDRQAVTPITELKWLIKRRDRLQRWSRQDAKEAQKHKKDIASLSEEIVSMQSVPPRRVVLIVSELNPQTLASLQLGDIHRYGGYSRYADEMERNLAEENKAKHDKFLVTLDDLSREAWGRSKGQGSKSIYDYIAGKRERGEYPEDGRATTLSELLGLAKGESILGRGGDIKTTP